MMTQLDLIEAIEFATRAHAGQTRKYGDSSGFKDPFILHPIRVMRRVAEFVEDRRIDDLTDGNYCDLLAIAVLHDTIEDTNTKPRELEDLFGSFVANGVMWLTEPVSTENRALRKKAARDHYAKAPAYCQIIKMFDRIDNLYDMRLAPKKYTTEVFIPESIELKDAIGSADHTVRGLLIDAINWLYVVMEPHEIPWREMVQ